MRILVRHIPNTYNYGSLMMAITAIDYLNRYLEHAESSVQYDGVNSRMRMA